MMAKLSRMDQSIIFDWFNSIDFIEDNLVSFGAVVETKVDCIGTVISMKSQGFVPLIIRDGEGSMEFCFWVELELLQVLLVVSI